MGKQLIRSVLLITTTGSLLLGACCKKVECPEKNEVYVQFYNYTRAQLDTVITTGYKPGTNFGEVAVAARIDGVEDTVNADGSWTYKPINGRYPYDEYDWTLYLPKAGKTYKITGYSYTTFSCSCMWDKVKTLSECTVNGAVQPVTPAKAYRY